MDRNARVLIIGGNKVGKTTLADVLQNNSIKRERKSQNNNSLPRYREEYLAKVNYDGEEIDVAVIDCRMHHGSITNSYLDQVKVIVLMFDIGNPKSFRELPYWLANLLLLRRNRSLENISECTILVGNKRDQPTTGIEQRTIDQFCREERLDYVAIDCHTKRGITDLKQHIAQKVQLNAIIRKPSMEILEQDIKNGRFTLTKMSEDNEKKKKPCSGCQG